MEIVCQVVILMLGLTSQTLVTRKVKWWIVVSLCNQPFWFIVTLTHRQWGMFILSIVYTYLLFRGIPIWFNKPTDPNLAEVIGESDILAAV